MPKVKRSRKRPPEGWELIEPTLDELDQKMREGKLRACCIYLWFFKTFTLITLINAHLAETETHEGKRKVEALWPIFK